MAQRTGALVFDELTDRYDIRFDLSDYYGGLHCGDCLEVFVRGKWKPTRMEYGQNWYLVGVRAEDLNGLTRPTNQHPDGFTFRSTMFKYMDSTEVVGGEIIGGKTGYTEEAGLCL